MKVSFITRHNIINYGSVLQTIALQKMIERFGYQAEVIDYIRTDEDFRNIAKVLANRNAKCQKSCLFKMFFITGKSLEFQIAGKKFEQIRNRYLKVSKRYSTLKELRENPPEADIYMTGSDQVWGGIGEDRYDSAFFLDFGDSTKKRLSYAASFGRTDMSEDILKIYSELLKKYSVISVREESARQILINQGYSKTIQVLDPTLLLTSKEWDNIVTIEASGIALALMAALELDVPLVFARKKKSILMVDDVYHSVVYSYTKEENYDITISKKFLPAGEKVLIIDDFLASGEAAMGLAKLVKDAGDEVVGMAIAIEKSFQPGRERLENAGFRVESLVRIKEFKDNKCVFIED